MKIAKAEQIMREYSINRINRQKDLTIAQKRALRVQVGRAKVALSLAKGGWGYWNSMRPEKQKRKIEAYERQ